MPQRRRCFAPMLAPCLCVLLFATMMLTILSGNVTSFHKRAGAVLEQASADVLCLQEARVSQSGALKADATARRHGWNLELGKVVPVRGVHARSRANRTVRKVRPTPFQAPDATYVAMAKGQLPLGVVRLIVWEVILNTFSGTGSVLVSRAGHRINLLTKPKRDLDGLLASQHVLAVMAESFFGFRRLKSMFSRTGMLASSRRFLPFSVRCLFKLNFCHMNVLHPPRWHACLFFRRRFAQILLTALPLPGFG